MLNGGETDTILAVMGQMVIVKAECLYTPDVIRYTAFSELFEPVECYLEPPRYDIQIVTESGGEVKIMALRSDCQ